MAKELPDPQFITISGIEEVYAILRACDVMEQKYGKIFFQGFDAQSEPGYFTFAPSIIAKEFPRLSDRELTAVKPMLAIYRRIVKGQPPYLQLVKSDNADE